VAWAIQVGGASYRTAAQRAFDAAPARSFEATPPCDVDEDTLRHFGRLSPLEERLIQRRGIEQVLTPAMLALTGAERQVAARIQSTAESCC
jgi:hypothetical protein